MYSARVILFAILAVVFFESTFGQNEQRADDPNAVQDCRNSCVPQCMNKAPINIRNTCVYACLKRCEPPTDCNDPNALQDCQSSCQSQCMNKAPVTKRSICVYDCLKRCKASTSCSKS